MPSLADQNQSESLLDQWHQLDGYQTQLHPQTAWQMSQAQLDDVAGTNAWLQDNGYVDPPTNAPWMQYGISRNRYHSLMGGYDQTWQQATGDSSGAEGVQQALQQGLTPEQYRQKLAQDPQITSRYPWLKYGQDYQQAQRYQQAGMQPPSGGQDQAMQSQYGQQTDPNLGAQGQQGQQGQQDPNQLNNPPQQQGQQMPSGIRRAGRQRTG